MRRLTLLLGVGAVLTGQWWLRSRVESLSPLVVAVAPLLIGAGLVASFVLPAGGTSEWRGLRRSGAGGGGGPGGGGGGGGGGEEGSAQGR
jgi:apolipoprotein N-acyltransferase